MGLDEAELTLACGESRRTAWSRDAAVGLMNVLSPCPFGASGMRGKPPGRVKLPVVLEHAMMGETPAAKGEGIAIGDMAGAAKGDCGQAMLAAFALIVGEGQKLAGVWIPEIIDAGVAPAETGCCMSFLAGAKGQTTVRHVVMGASCGVWTTGDI